MGHLFSVSYSLSFPAFLSIFVVLANVTFGAREREYLPSLRTHAKVHMHMLHPSDQVDSVPTPQTISILILVCESERASYFFPHWQPVLTRYRYTVPSLSK